MVLRLLALRAGRPLPPRKIPSTQRAGIFNDTTVDLNQFERFREVTKLPQNGQRRDETSVQFCTVAAIPELLCAAGCWAQRKDETGRP
jgi:hypothetical protein